jgi:hypothetical protein
MRAWNMGEVSPPLYPLLSHPLWVDQVWCRQLTDRCQFVSPRVAPYVIKGDARAHKSLGCQRH